MVAETNAIAVTPQSPPVLVGVEGGVAEGEVVYKQLLKALLVSSTVFNSIHMLSKTHCDTIGIAHQCLVPVGHVLLRAIHPACSFSMCA